MVDQLADGAETLDNTFTEATYTPPDYPEEEELPLLHLPTKDPFEIPDGLYVNNPTAANVFAALERSKNAAGSFKEIGDQIYEVSKEYFVPFLTLFLYL